MARIDPAQLSDWEMRFRETRSVAIVLKAARHLGPLAAWWLDAEALALAVSEEPSLQSMINTRLPNMAFGGCRVIAIRSTSERSPCLLSPDVVFPLQWRADSRHSPRLPASLVDLANRVLQAPDLRATGATNSTWGLHLASECESVDLSLFTPPMFEANSGWASLAGGLMLAAQGIRARADVWTSGSYRKGVGIVGVNEIESKLASARRFGAEKVFLPIENRPDATRWNERQSTPLQIRYFPIDEKPGQFLKPYLENLGLPPPSDADRAARSNYYVLLGDATVAREYFRKTLLQETADRLRPEFRSQTDGREIDLLITIVSLSDELVELAAKVVRPRRCLLLHDRERSELASNLRQRLAAENIGATLCQFKDESIHSLRVQFDDFVQAEPTTGHVVVDLTPGKKKMTVALAEIAQAHGFHFLYIDHREIPKERARPESLTVDFRQSIHSEASPDKSLVLSM